MSEADGSEGARERAMAAAKKMKEEVRRKEPLLNSKPRTSRDDPNFMQSFFKASRLHFIGTWKARYQEILDSVPPPPPLPPPLAHGGRIIAHVDMDCFFCSVGVKGRSELQGQPVAVCWGDATSENAQHAEISSANYVARKFGVRAGMFIGKAKELCPQLITIPYEFDKYTSTAETMYRCLFAITPHVQGVSVDEAFADITSLVAGENVQNLKEVVIAVANRIRKEILEATGCPASVGCAGNRFLAKIATSQAKPDGSFFIPKENVLDFLAELPVSKLPGVGYNTVDKLSKLEVHSVQDLRNRPRAFLQEQFGEKTGRLLFEFSRGIDNRPWESRPIRKSVGAQITWGVRFNEMSEVFQFIEKLSAEVSSRMHKARVKGRTVQVTLLRAVKNAPDNARKGHLGHGICEHLTRSVTLSQFTDDAKSIEKHVCAIVNDLRVPASEIRGLGVQMTKLDSQASSKEATASRRVTLPAPPRREFDASKAPNWLKAFTNVTSPSKQTDKSKTSNPQSASPGRAAASPDTPEASSPAAVEKNTSKRSFADVNEMYASWYSMHGSPKSSSSSPNKILNAMEHKARSHRPTSDDLRSQRRFSPRDSDGMRQEQELDDAPGQRQGHLRCEEEHATEKGADWKRESDAPLDRLLAAGFSDIELAYHKLISEKLAGRNTAARSEHVQSFLADARNKLAEMGEEVQGRGCEREKLLFIDRAFGLLLQMSGCHLGDGDQWREKEEEEEEMTEGEGMMKSLMQGWSLCVEEVLRTFDEEPAAKRGKEN